MMNISSQNGSLNSSTKLDAPVSSMKTVQLTITLVYSVMFILSLSGNSMTVYIVLAKPYMRSITNCLIANVAIADLIMTLSAMPYSVAYAYVESRWFPGVLGTVTCKLVHFSVILSIAASIIMMVVISLDRFFAVVYPFKRASVIRKISVTCAVVWLVSGVLASPYLYSYKVLLYDGHYHCYSVWEPLADTFRASRIYFTFVFICLYLLPLSVIAAFYSSVSFKLWIRKIPGNPTATTRQNAEQSKRRTIKMLIIIVIVFALCWLPAHVMHFMFYFEQEMSESFPAYLSLVAFGISHGNSALNPYLYIALNKIFRRAVWDELRNCFAPARDLVRSRSNTTSHTNLARDMSLEYVQFAGLGGRTGVYELTKTENAGAVPCDRQINLLKVTSTEVQLTNS